VASWARVEERMVEWDGRWIAVHTGGLSRSRRGAQRSRLRALDFLGFRELVPNLWIRPHNLAGGVIEVRRQLHALGLESKAPVFAIGDLDRPSEAYARGLWDVSALLAGYRKMRRALEDSERQMKRLPVEETMVESFLLGGRAIRQLSFDPLLPEAIMPGAERAALARVMRRYDRVGKQSWSAFMRAHRAPYQRTPVNMRVVGGAGDLPAAAGSRS
jgi:phenylacetic acid degradation operon negative regulatory protein